MTTEQIAANLTVLNFSQPICCGHLSCPRCPYYDTSHSCHLATYFHLEETSGPALSRITTLLRKQFLSTRPELFI